MALVKKGAKWVPEWQADVDMANSVSDQPQGFELSEEDQLAQDEMVANAEKKRAEMKAQGLPMAADILKKDEVAPEDESKPAIDKDLAGLKGVAKPAAIPDAAKMKPKATEIKAKAESANQAIAAASDKQLDQGIKTDINKDPETMPPEIKNDLKWLQGKYAQLDKEYADKADNLEWRGVMETVAQSLTQLFAAREGLKAGVDMSGLKFNKTDFDKKLDQVTADIQRRKGQAENIYQESGKLESAKAAGEAAKEEKDYQRGRDVKKDELENKKFLLDENKANADMASKTRELDLKAAELGKANEVDPALIVPEAGIAFDKEAAKLMREAKVDTDGAVRALDGLIGMSKDWNSLSPTEKGKAQTMASTLIGKLRIPLTGPGAMSEGDRKMLENVIGNPTSFFSYEPAEVAKLQSLRDSVNSSYQDRVKTYIYKPFNKPAAEETSKQQAAPHGNTVVQDGVTYKWNGSEYVEE
jgi:hypothetical protein